MEYNEQDNNEQLEGQGMVFDFRGLIFKILNLWKLVFLSIGVALIIAYFINVRKENIYRLSSLISIESEQNPFFTANTSISFNWGGVSGKVGLVITTFKTRTHNEKVVDSLQYYMRYLKQGKYRKDDIYKQAPFILELDKNKGQILNIPIGIRFINDSQYEIFAEFETDRAPVQFYNTSKKKRQVSIPKGSFKKTYAIGDPVNLPFLNFKLHKLNANPIPPQSEYYVQFSHFDNIVSQYSRAISVGPNGRTSSVLKIDFRWHE